MAKFVNSFFFLSSCAFAFTFFPTLKRPATCFCSLPPCLSLLAACFLDSRTLFAPCKRPNFFLISNSFAASFAFVRTLSSRTFCKASLSFGLLGFSLFTNIPKFLFSFPSFIVSGLSPSRVIRPFRLIETIPPVFFLSFFNSMIFLIFPKFLRPSMLAFNCFCAAFNLFSLNPGFFLFCCTA